MLRPVLSLVAIRHKALAAFERNPGIFPEQAARECAQEPLPRVMGPSDVRGPDLGEANWVRAFAKRLFQLQGSIRGRNSTAAARRSYRDARDLSPVEAAEIYAADLPPPHVGSPGN